MQHAFSDRSFDFEFMFQYECPSGQCDFAVPVYQPQPTVPEFDFTFGHEHSANQYSLAERSSQPQPPMPSLMEPAHRRPQPGLAGFEITFEYEYPAGQDGLTEPAYQPQFVVVPNLILTVPEESVFPGCSPHTLLDNPKLAILPAINLPRLDTIRLSQQFISFTPGLLTPETAKQRKKRLEQEAALRNTSQVYLFAAPQTYSSDETISPGTLQTFHDCFPLNPATEDFTHRETAQAEPDRVGNGILQDLRVMPESATEPSFDFDMDIDMDLSWLS